MTQATKTNPLAYWPPGLVCRLAVPSQQRPANGRTPPPPGRPPSCQPAGTTFISLECRIAGVVVAHIYPGIGILTHDFPALREPPMIMAGDKEGRSQDHNRPVSWVGRYWNRTSDLLGVRRVWSFLWPGLWLQGQVRCSSSARLRGLGNVHAGCDLPNSSHSIMEEAGLVHLAAESHLDELVIPPLVRYDRSVR
jgi:hypothetical protein